MAYVYWGANRGPGSHESCGYDGFPSEALSDWGTAQVNCTGRLQTLNPTHYLPAAVCACLWESEPTGGIPAWRRECVCDCVEKSWNTLAEASLKLYVWRESSVQGQRKSGEYNQRWSSLCLPIHSPPCTIVGWHCPQHYMSPQPLPISYRWLGQGWHLTQRKIMHKLARNPCRKRWAESIKFFCRKMN